MFKYLTLEKIFKIMIGGGLLVLIVIIFSQPINLTSVDLGRHLTNGKIVWQNPAVLYTNFYSYTEPNFPFINHHWLAGVILYGIYLLGGFSLLSIFNVVLALLIFILTFSLAKKKAGFYLSAVISLPVIFLLSERVEVRPEAFSYLFIILTWIIIDRVSARRNYRQLWWLIPLFILWVNLHIYWFIGLALLGFKMVAEFLPPLFKKGESWSDRRRQAGVAIKPWFSAFIGVAVACLINPNTWRGFLYPFFILHNYGYQIAENKTIFYLGHLMINYNFFIFKVLLGLLVVSFLVDGVVSRKVRWLPIFIALFFSAAALFASRNLALFALITLVLTAENLALATRLVGAWLTTKFSGVLSGRLYFVGALLALIIFSLGYLTFDGLNQHNFIKNSLGWGLAPGVAASAQFWTINKLSGPIFNNYDIGSALIFWLYPSEKVFVDNRPEAYSVKFFSDIYKPMQTSTAVWQTMNTQYKFKAIWFAYTDSTPWAQQFLTTILHDPNWALVYFDRSTVILLSKKLNETTTLDKLSIDSQTFRTRWRALVAASPDINQQLALASLAQLAGQNDLAQEIYQEIIFRYPDDRQAYAALGYLYAASADPADWRNALFYLDRARYFGDELPGVYDEIGLVNWNLGDYKNAAVKWRAALGLDSGDASALYYLKQIEDLRAAGKLPRE